MIYLVFRGAIVGAVVGAAFLLVLEVTILAVGRDFVREVFRSSPTLAAIYLVLLWFPLPIFTLIGGIIGLFQERDRRQGRR